MKVSFVLCIVVLSVMFVFNEACTGRGRARPTERPTTAKPKPVRPKKIQRIRIFSFAGITTKPALKKYCKAPNVCLESCGLGRYVLGRYDCTGASWCCANY